MKALSRRLLLSKTIRSCALKIQILYIVAFGGELVRIMVMERQLFLFIGLVATFTGLYFLGRHGAVLWLQMQQESLFIFPNRDAEFFFFGFAVFFLGGFLFARGLKKLKSINKDK